MYQILTDPNTFLKRNAEKNNMVQSFVIVLMTGAILSSSNFLLFSKLSEATNQTTTLFLLIPQLVGMATSILVVLLIWFVNSVILYFFAKKMFDGAGDFRRTMQILAWGFVPTCISGIISILAVYQALIPIAPPETVNGMSEIAAQVDNNPLVSLLKWTGLVFTLWQGLLWSIGLEHTMNLDRKKAILTVTPVLVVSIIWSLFELI